jgi:hypothetical protein
MDAEVNNCPHCGAALLRWMPPEDSSWGLYVQLVCFNDECPYYISGWQRMKDQYQQKASYRYRFNPKNGEHGPLPVWDENAHRDRILDDKENQ